MSWVGLRIHEHGEREEVGSRGCGGGVERRWHCEMGESHGDFQKAFIGQSIHSIPKLPRSLPAANPNELPIQTLTMHRFPIRTSFGD
jgi:hypothetical protein